MIIKNINQMHRWNEGSYPGNSWAKEIDWKVWWLKYGFNLDFLRLCLSE